MLTWRGVALITGTRVFVFLAGWLLTSRFGDWRQLVGYPLMVVGSLPDAILVRYAVSPNSTSWPLTMVLSLIVSSAAIATVAGRRRS